MYDLLGKGEPDNVYKDEFTLNVIYNRDLFLDAASVV
jgi:hypothetical protein